MGFQFLRRQENTVSRSLLLLLRYDYLNRSVVKFKKMKFKKQWRYFSMLNIGSSNMKVTNTAFVFTIKIWERWRGLSSQLINLCALWQTEKGENWRRKWPWGEGYWSRERGNIVGISRFYSRIHSKGCGQGTQTLPSSNVELFFVTTRGSVGWVLHLQSPCAYTFLISANGSWDDDGYTYGRIFWNFSAINNSATAEKVMKAEMNAHIQIGYMRNLAKINADFEA